MSKVESPEIAAERCSETQLLAVPRTPRRRKARSGASVAMATSINRRLPMYLGEITVPSSSVPPRRYVDTAHGESFHLGGRGFVSALASASSSAANWISACSRTTSDVDPAVGPTGAEGLGFEGAFLMLMRGAPGSCRGGTGSRRGRGRAGGR